MTVQINKGSALEAVSITPLIDIVFLLLIFFMVTNKFAQEDREMEMPLPSASEAQPLIAQPKEIFINIDGTGNYFVGGQPMTVPQIEQKLERAIVNNPTQSVIVRSHKRCELQAVVDVMNVCKKVGAEYVLTTGVEDG
jgi:biopolymer transport protein ExbD